MDNPLDFLDGDAPAETPAVVEQPAAEATVSEAPQAEGEAPKAPARGPDGKFAKVEATPVADAPPQSPAPAPDAVQPTVETPKVPDGYVPVEALTTLRKEFQAFKQQVTQQQAAPPPDPFEDFEAYEAHQASERTGERFDWSYQLLTARHGDEQAARIRDWAAQRADADPHFHRRALESRDPFGFAFAEYQQAEALQMLADPTLRERFQAFLTGQAPPQQAAAPVAAPQSPTAPPPSITQAPSAGGVAAVPMGQQSVYDAVFT